VTTVRSPAELGAAIFKRLKGRVAKLRAVKAVVKQKAKSTPVKAKARVAARKAKVAVRKTAPRKTPAKKVVKPRARKK
jgi:hypothetical protein